MVKNKGQATILGLMLFVMVLTFAIMIIPSFKENIIWVRGDEGMNCTSETLTTGQSMTCLAVDLFLPYFIIAIVLAGGGLIAYKYGLVG